MRIGGCSVVMQRPWVDKEMIGSAYTHDSLAPMELSTFIVLRVISVVGIKRRVFAWNWGSRVGRLSTALQVKKVLASEVCSQRKGGLQCTREPRLMSYCRKSLEALATADQRGQFSSSC